MKKSFFLTQVRDQGQCGSCWAQAVVGALNDKLCIASGGEFRTVLSTTDVTACDKQTGMGCDGGYTGPVIDGFLTHTGVVTGGGQADVRQGDTCYPYYLGGEGEDHFHASQTTPPCRSSCYESNYPRAYQQDKYYATERSYHIYREGGGGWGGGGSSTPDFAKLKRELYEKGSVVLSYDCQQQMSYRGGIWDCRGGQAVHAVKCVGYGTDPREGDYVVCVNSWGDDWGERGTFRMKYPGNGCMGMGGFEAKMLLNSYSSPKIIVK